MKFSRSKTIALIFGAFSLCSFCLAGVDYYEQYRIQQINQSGMSFNIDTINFMQADLLDITLILGFLCGFVALFTWLNGIKESSQNYKIVP